MLLGFFLGIPKTLNFRDTSDTTIENPSPNIIVILADDLGYRDVGFNGSEDIPTPNIDRIAREGVIFKNAYVSYPVCGPSRAGLITGRYQDRFGFARNPLFAPNDTAMGLSLSEETMADALHKGGYKSVALGKWHLGAHKSLHPLNRGFDDFFGFLSGGHQYFPDQWNLQDGFEAKTQYDGYRTKLLRDHQRVEENEYLTDALSREAVAYVEKYKSSPFFMYLAYNAPHGPMQATEKYLDRFPHIKETKRKTYAAMVSAMDDGVGLLLEKLDELDLADNTIIFFLSDNGGPEHHNASDNGVLRGGKGELFEGGIHVPFVMRWPSRLQGGMTYSNPVLSLDIFATAVAQSVKPVPLKNSLDGVDLIPYLLGEKEGNPHAYLYWRTFDQDNFAIRDSAGMKHSVIKGTSLLFDLSMDIGENTNILEAHLRGEERLRKEYQKWNSEMIDPVFLGLMQDDEYNAMHPDRYKKQE